MLRNSAIIEENIRFWRGDHLCNSNVFFHNGGKLRKLAYVKDLYTRNHLNYGRDGHQKVVNDIWNTPSHTYDSVVYNEKLYYGPKNIRGPISPDVYYTYVTSS